MLQKFPSGQCSSNAPLQLAIFVPSVPTLSGTSPSVVELVQQLKSVPTGSSASSRITPPCWLTEIVRVENLNGALLSLTPVTSICMLTTARAVLRRSILRQCMIAIRKSSGRRSDSRPQLPGRHAGPGVDTTARTAFRLPESYRFAPPTRIAGRYQFHPAFLVPFYHTFRPFPLPDLSDLLVLFRLQLL